MAYNVSPYFGLLSGRNKQIRQGLEAGQGFANEFYPSGGLERLDTSVPADMAKLRSAYYASAFGPSAPTPSSTTALRSLGNLAQTAGTRSQEMKDLLARQQAGLGGLNAQENAALRESGTIGLDQSLQTALRQLRGNQLGTNAMGPAAGIAAQPAIQQFAQAQQGLQRDLTLANLEEKARRMQQYQGLLTGQEGAEYAQKLGARTAYQTAAEARNQFQIQDRANRLNAYQNTLNNIYNRQDTQNLFNIGQGEKERAGQLGLILGGGGFGASNWAAQQGFDIAREGIGALQNPAETIPNYGGGYLPSTGIIKTPGWL